MRGVSGEGYRRRVSDSPGKAYRGIIRGVSREEYDRIKRGIMRGVSREGCQVKGIKRGVFDQERDNRRGLSEEGYHGRDMNVS